ncbi:MAG: FAD-binding oxidoreductase [Bacteroidales bacterium]|nr:FAD-binding oxidoreductase [Bacteroidales bacterium]
MEELTVWNAGLDVKTFPVLQGSIEADVLIIGAGITGLTAAYLLALEGKM